MRQPRVSADRHSAQFAPRTRARDSVLGIVLCVWIVGYDSEFSRLIWIFHVANHAESTVEPFIRDRLAVVSLPCTHHGTKPLDLWAGLRGGDAFCCPKARQVITSIRTTMASSLFIGGSLSRIRVLLL